MFARRSPGFGGLGTQPHDRSAIGGTSENRFGMSGREAGQHGGPELEGAAEHGDRLASALCGGGDSGTAGPSALGQTAAIYRGVSQASAIEFLEFMDRVVADTRWEKKSTRSWTITASTRKTMPGWRLHPNVFFHFTPTSASWLNQVEVWFGILSRKALRGASFRDIEQLRKAIEELRGRLRRKPPRSSGVNAKSKVRQIARILSLTYAIKY